MIMGVVMVVFGMENEVYENHVSGSGDGILVLASRSDRVYRNTIVGNECGVNLTLSIRAVVAWNRLVDNEYGVFLNSSFYSNVTGNYIRSSSWGVELRYSTHNRVCSNHVRSSGTGIRLYNSTDNRVCKNILELCSLGVMVSYSSQNLIRMNEVAGNGFGAELYYSQGNVLRENVFSENTYGLVLMSSSGNEIYHNNFVNNSRQAYSTNSVNKWDGGYPSGGNYWSDYAGVDEKRGPGQDQPGSDGIGDTPYIIDRSNEDRYPFTSMVAPRLVLEELLEALTWGGVLNVTFVVGDSGSHEHTGSGAATADVVGAIRVAEAFSRIVGGASVEALTDVSIASYSNGVVDVDWDEVETYSLVVVGGPGVNYMALRYNDTLPFVWRYVPGVKSCIYSSLSSAEYYTGYRRYDYAIIAITWDEEGSKPVLVVWGLTRHGTQAACILLQHLEEYTNMLRGRAVIVRWDDSNGNGMADLEDEVRLVESWS